MVGSWCYWDTHVGRLSANGPYRIASHGWFLKMTCKEGRGRFPPALGTKHPNLPFLVWQDRHQEHRGDGDWPGPTLNSAADTIHPDS